MHSLGHFLAQTPHFAPPLCTYVQAGGVDDVGVGHRLWEGDVGRLALGDAAVEVAEHSRGADLGADVAGDAILVDARRALRAP